MSVKNSFVSSQLRSSKISKKNYDQWWQHLQIIRQAGRNKFKEKISGYDYVKSVYEMRIAAENMYFGCHNVLLGSLWLLCLLFFCNGMHRW